MEEETMATDATTTENQAPMTDESAVDSHAVTNAVDPSTANTHAQTATDNTAAEALNNSAAHVQTATDTMTNTSFGGSHTHDMLGFDPTTDVLTVDPNTMVDAAGTDTIFGSIQHFLVIGGPVVWILMAISVVALAIILIKFWQYSVVRPEATSHHKAVMNHWRRGETKLALSKLNNKRPVDELMHITMTGLSQKAPNIEVLKEELDRVATLRLNQLRSYLRPLEVIASLSPLLGLFGTVLGMIQAFQQMQAAGSQVDPSVLSGGIWVALLTTAVGLAIAMPTVVAHNWMERKVERVAALMNDTVTLLFTQKGKAGPASEEEQAAIRNVA